LDARPLAALHSRLHRRAAGAELKKGEAGAGSPNLSQNHIVRASQGRGRRITKPRITFTTHEHPPSISVFDE